MNAQLAFKHEFLIFCARQGLTPQETLARVKEARAALPELLKEANNPLTAATGWGSHLFGLGKNLLVDKPFDLIKALGPTALSLLAVTGVAAPVAAGMMGGRLGAGLSEDDMTVDEAKARELALAYNAETQGIKRRQALRRLSGGTP